MGLIPSEISTLTKLNHVYAPSLIEVIDCWSCIYWVLVMRAFSQLFKGALQRSLEQPAHRDNPTTSIGAHKTDWKRVHCWAVSPCFIECWSCAPLPHAFKRSALFYVQGPLAEPARWNHSSADICTGQPASPVSLHFFFIECWPEYFSILVSMSVGMSASQHTMSFFLQIA